MEENNKNRIFGIESRQEASRMRISSEQEATPRAQDKAGGEGGRSAIKLSKKTWNQFVIIILLSVSIGLGLVLVSKFGNSNFFTNIFSSKEKSKLADINILDEDRLRSKMPEEKELPQDRDLYSAVKLYRSGYNKSARAAFDKIVESSKDNDVKAFALVYMGILADEEGKFKQAIDYYREAVRFQPKNYFAHYNMAMTYKHKGDYKLAKEELEIAHKIRPENTDVATLKSELEMESGDYESSESTLKDIIENTKDAKAYYNLGLVYKKEGKLAEAKSVFLKAIDATGSAEASYQSLVELGKIYANEADYENAEIYLMRALKVRPENAKQYYNLAVIQYSAGKKEEAKKSLDKAMEGVMDKPEHYVYIANLYRKLNRLQDAEIAIRKAKSMAPFHPEILKTLSDILIEQSKWSEAIDYLKKLAELNTGTIEKAQTYYQLGRAYMETGDFRNAEKYLQLAYSMDNVNEDALIALGNLYYMKGESHKTIDLYKKALNINPDNVAILKALGVLYFNLHLYSEAEDTFKKVLDHPLRKDKDVYVVYNSLGKIYKEKKMYDNALTYFKKAALTTDEDIQFDALMEIADCSLQADKPAVSVFSDIEKAIAIKPDSYEARVMLAKALMKDGSASSRDRAEEEVKTVIEMEKKPDVLSKAYTLRGILFYKEGFYKKAIDDFNAALELDPSNSEAFQNKTAAASQLDSEM